MNDFLKSLQEGLSCRCPQCLKGRLYPSFFDLKLQDECPACGLDLAKNDSADGPAVFLIFILGFLLVPLALVFDHWIEPPLWVHGLLWGTVAISMTLGALKPLKSYIIHLQYKHRRTDWN
ncbi:MAG TPA: DUF983 domain-containing protein [Alphaproteobacteria bacterium]|nr:DUF983 domain-containing protein [Alphaproteobacteria bacterium]